MVPLKILKILEHFNLHHGMFVIIKLKTNILCLTTTDNQYFMMNNNKESIFYDVKKIKINILRYK